MDKCNILNIYYSHTLSDALFINCEIGRLLKDSIYIFLKSDKHETQQLIVFCTDIPNSLLKILVKPFALQQHQMHIHDIMA